jgi:ketosteroid isomerase-like protein
MVERRGREAVGSFFEVVGQMEVVDFAVHNLLEGGDEVAATFTFEAKLPNHGGGHYRDEEIHLWTFDAEGKVVRLRHYIDTAKHLAALTGP